MKEVLSWIVEHYELLILVGACLLDIVLFLFGVFRKKESPVLNVITDMLPSMINEAERLVGDGNGEKKLTYVLSNIELIYQKLTGTKLILNSYLYQYFRKRIESILSTPQKKGK